MLPLVVGRHFSSLVLLEMRILIVQSDGSVVCVSPRRNLTVYIVLLRIAFGCDRYPNCSCEWVHMLVVHEVCINSIVG